MVAFLVAVEDAERATREKRVNRGLAWLNQFRSFDQPEWLAVRVDDEQEAICQTKGLSVQAFFNSAMTELESTVEDVRETGKGLHWLL